MEVLEKRIKETMVAYIPYMGSFDKIPELMQEWVSGFQKKVFNDWQSLGTLFTAPKILLQKICNMKLFFIEGVAIPEGKVGY